MSYLLALLVFREISVYLKWKPLFMKSTASKKSSKIQYTEQELELASMGRLLSNVDRIILLEVLMENKQCRVTQLAMESGLSYRSVYYHLSRLRKKDVIRTYYDKGRYMIVQGEGAPRVFRFYELLSSFAGGDRTPQVTLASKATHLRVLK